MDRLLPSWTRGTALVALLVALLLTSSGCQWIVDFDRSLIVDAGPDAATTDAGSDAGAVDAGSDAGATDAGAPDAGPGADSGIP